MKYADIKKIQEVGLITPEQGTRIIEHFKLKEHDSKFLAIISILGAVLVACGITLLIAANWDEIPRGVKIITGLVLMLGAHGAGWYLREVNGGYRKVGEGLHLLGSGLFLANIALIGQVYHLSSRPPNAILLWWVGIAALPWVLRSAAQYVLLLLAFGLWFGMEINEPGSWMFFGQDEFQLLLYCLLGLVVLGTGYCLRRSSFASFSVPSENLGLLAFQASFFPLTWGLIYHHYTPAAAVCAWLLPLMSVAALLVLGAGVSRLNGLSQQWRWTWGLALAGAIALVACAMYIAPMTTFGQGHENNWFRWLCAAGLFGFCLLEIQVGIQTRQEFMVNLGVAFIALNIVSTYLNLFGSMARTGLMFLISGVLLIVFGVFLEKKRRALLQQLKLSPTTLHGESSVQSEVEL